MKQILVALTVAATIFASSASAVDPDDLQKLKDTGNCAMCDLTGANLRSAKLVGANLTRTNLEGAKLRGADLTGVYMKGAILCNTTMPDGSVIYSGC